MHFLEGESLLNDASGLVCMRFAIAAALTGAFSPVDAFGTFLWVAIGGIAIGVGLQPLRRTGYRSASARRQVRRY
jgi:CPA1 family monovalent cation:H+ antiporter